MLRRHIDGQIPAMGTDRMDKTFRSINFRKQFRGFFAVSFGKSLEVDIMEKPCDAPELRFVGLAVLLGEIAHDRFDRPCMPKVEWILIVFFQQCHRCVSVDVHVPPLFQLNESMNRLALL